MFEVPAQPFKLLPSKSVIVSLGPDRGATAGQRFSWAIASGTKTTIAMARVSIIGMRTDESGTTWPGPRLFACPRFHNDPFDPQCLRGPSSMQTKKRRLMTAARETGLIVRMKPAMFLWLSSRLKEWK